MNKSQEKIIIKNQISEIKKVADLLESVANNLHLSRKILFTFRLTLEEILTNVISYAYKDEIEHFIEVTISYDTKHICMRIEDDGESFDPFIIPEPDLDAPLEDRQIGGLGIMLVKKFLDKYDHQYIKNKNVVNLIKNLEEEKNGNNN